MSGLEKIQKIVEFELGVREPIKPDTTLASLTTDSLETVNLLLVFEDEFKIEVEDVRSLLTIRDVLNIIEAKV